LLTKTIEFKTKYGQKIKVHGIPVMRNDHPHWFTVNMRLRLYLGSLHKQGPGTYSFREYLKRTLKWSEFEKIYQSEELKNNA